MGGHCVKICLEAAPGGHLAEMSLIWPALRKHDLCLLTNAVSPEMISSVTETFPSRVVFIPRQVPEYSGNRFVDYTKRLIVEILGNFLFCVRLLRKEKPDILLSTGCCTTIAMTLLAKVMGIRVIYVESPARIKTPSFTGRIVYWFADLFLVQWESLLKAYGTKAKYWGSVL